MLIRRLRSRSLQMRQDRKIASSRSPSLRLLAAAQKLYFAPTVINRPIAPGGAASICRSRDTFR